MYIYIQIINKPSYANTSKTQMKSAIRKTQHHDKQRWSSVLFVSILRFTRTIQDQPFLFSRGQNYSMVGSRQTWRLDVSARLQMSTPSQGFQHKECIVMGDESSPGQLYQQLSRHWSGRSGRSIWVGVSIFAQCWPSSIARLLAVARQYSLADCRKMASPHWSSTV